MVWVPEENLTHGFHEYSVHTLALPDSERDKGVHIKAYFTDSISRWLAQVGDSNKVIRLPANVCRIQNLPPRHGFKGRQTLADGVGLITRTDVPSKRIT